MHSALLRLTNMGSPLLSWADRYSIALTADLVAEYIANSFALQSLAMRRIGSQLNAALAKNEILGLTPPKGSFVSHPGDPLEMLPIDQRDSTSNMEKHGLFGCVPVAKTICIGVARVSISVHWMNILN